MAQAKKAAEDYEKAFETEDFYNVADLIVENKLLINKFDMLMGQQDQANDDNERLTTESEMGDLS